MKQNNIKSFGHTSTADQFCVEKEQQKKDAVLVIGI